MNSVAVTRITKKERKNLWVSHELVKRTNQVARTLRYSFSEVTREALESYVTKKEREKIDEEVALACKKHYNLDDEVVKDWEQFETVTE
jgi:predicted transcriptional regulator